jgi:HEAT repeat protein
MARRSSSIVSIALASALPWLTMTIKAQAPPAPKPAPVIVKDGQLTVNAQNRSLQWLLDEVSRQTGVAFIDNDAVDRSKFSGRFALPIDDALRKIVEGFDAFFLYGVMDQPPAKLRAVWIYPKGRGLSLAPVGAEKWASTSELAERLKSGDPLERALAVEALVERKGAQAIVEVLFGLSDVDEQVRSRTLYAALNAGLELPPDSLQRALQDESENVRFLALDSLSNRPDARAIIEHGLGDLSSHVQLKAREILKQFDAGSSSRNKPSPPDAPNGGAIVNKPQLTGIMAATGSWISAPARTVAPLPDASVDESTTAAGPEPGHVAPDPPTAGGADALDQLIEGRSPQALGAVLRALGDRDEQVRTRALFAALSGGLDLPVTALIQALADPSPNIRYLALDALADQPNARTYATQLTRDSNPHVGSEARRILDRLDAAARPRVFPSAQRSPPR